VNCVLVQVDRSFLRDGESGTQLASQRGVGATVKGERARLWLFLCDVCEDPLPENFKDDLFGQTIRFARAEEMIP
jgi:hypothetical protein